MIRNCQHAQASNVQIHWLDDSTGLEVSTLASSTLGHGSMYRFRSIFFEKNQWASEKGWCHVPIPLTQGPVPFMDTGSTFCVVQEHVPKNRRS